MSSRPAMSSPPVPQRRLLGLGVCAIAWLLAGAAVTLALAYRPYDNALDFQVHRQFFVLDVVIGFLYGPVAALVLTRTRHPLGWLLAVTAIGFAATGFAIQYALLGAEHPDLPLLGPVIHAVPWAWSVGAFAMVLVMPWILTDTRPTGWRLAAAWIGLGLTLAATLPRALLQMPGAPANPLALTGREGSWVQATLDNALVPLGVLFALVGAGHLVHRRAAAAEQERRGLGWVVVSLVMVTASYAAFDLGLRIGAPLLNLAAASLFAGEVMLPAAVLVLVMRQQLWGLDVAVSRATLWGLLSALLIGSYVALVGLGGRFLPWDRDVSAAVAAAALALGVQPVRQWMQVRVDRLVYGTGTDAGRLLAGLGEAAHSEGLDGLAERLRHDLRLAHVEIRSVGGPPWVLASSGDPGTPSTVRVALTNQEREVGELAVAARTGERLDPRTVQLLTQVAGMVAVAVELARTNEQLAAARDRTLHVRHEERRLLRRELHDSLGPALAGVGLGLAAIENDTARLSERNTTLLHQLREEVTRRAEDVRTMAHALLPPALDDGRLEEALLALARRFSGALFEVEVDASGADRIDTLRQVAVYHVAGEALLNAHRHSGATRCSLRVRHGDDGVVTLTVHDDGIGVPNGASTGLGLRSIRERAEEAGGDLRIEARAGTLVEMRLP